MAVVRKRGQDLLIEAIYELGITDPTQTPEASQLKHAQAKAHAMLDSWATERLFIRGPSIKDYNLIAGTQVYTIGPGGDFDQEPPERIESWSVLDPAGYERDRGRPVDIREWQRIHDKASRTSDYPRLAFYDRKFDESGHGTIRFWPIPSTGYSVRLYQFLPEIRTIDPAAFYVLPEGYERAIVKNLALEMAPAYGAGAIISPLLIQQAQESKAAVKRSNIRSRPAAMLSDFMIGSERSSGHGRGYDIETDSS